ncbi:MAG: hypothetical protein ACRCU2_15840 [Planktothrix sp.]
MNENDKEKNIHLSFERVFTDKISKNPKVMRTLFNNNVLESLQKLDSTWIKTNKFTDSEALILYELIFAAWQKNHHILLRKLANSGVINPDITLLHQSLTILSKVTITLNTCSTKLNEENYSLWIKTFDEFTETIYHLILVFTEKYPFPEVYHENFKIAPIKKFEFHKFLKASLLLFQKSWNNLKTLTAEELGFLIIAIIFGVLVIPVSGIIIFVLAD